MNKYKVKLTKEERKTLLSFANIEIYGSIEILRARILLASDEGDYIDEKSIKTDEEISILLNIGLKTVKRVRKLFVLEGLEAALVRKKSSKTRSAIEKGPHVDLGREKNESNKRKSE